MNSQLQQVTNMEKPVVASLHLFSSISPQKVECHTCDARGDCLADQMMESSALSEKAHNHSRTYKQGAHIFREEDQALALYVVKSGSVKSYITTEDGDEQILEFSLPGDVIGLDNVEGGKCGTSAKALECTSVCKLPISQLSDEGRGRGYPRLVSDQLSRNRNLLLILARKDADARLASFICDLASRFESCGYSATQFNLTMSRQDIGSYLGLAIETVSRTFTRFQESGLINVNRRMVKINDQKKLKQMAGIRV